MFGDWGSGKTFFMRPASTQQVAQVVDATAEDDGFEHAIVQIQFNAWHYAEINLWASLVGHIFDELDRWMTRRGDPALSSKADDILKRLATSRQLTLEAASELVRRRKEQKKASDGARQGAEGAGRGPRDAEQAPRGCPGRRRSRRRAPRSPPIPS